MVAGLCQSTICRLFVLSGRKDDKTTRRQNDNYRLFAPKRRQNDKMTERKDDKTTKLGRKDDKHNPLISDLICRLFAWRFVVLSSFRLEKTTERQDDKTIIVVFSPRKDDKTKSRQDDKTPSEKTTN